MNVKELHKYLTDIMNSEPGAKDWKVSKTMHGDVGSLEPCRVSIDYLTGFIYRSQDDIDRDYKQNNVKFNPTELLL